MSARPQVSLRAQIGVYGVGGLANSGTVMIWVLVPLWMTQLDASAFAIGLAMGIRSLIPLFVAIPVGAVMDRLGIRRVVICFSLVGVVLPPLYPLLPSVTAVILLQAFGGFATTIGWVGAQALIGKVMKSDQTYAGRLSFWVRMCTLVCPTLAGGSWDLGGAWGGFAMLEAWGIFQLICILLVPADAHPAGQAAKLVAADLMPRWADYRDAFRLLVIPIVAVVIAISLLRMSASAVQGSFFVVYLKSIGLSATQIGILVSGTSMFGSMSALTSGRWVRLFRDYWVLTAATAMSIVAVMVTPLLTSFWALLFVTIFRGIGTGVSQPLMISIGQSAAGSGHHGKMAALRTTTNRVAEAAIPMIMGVVVEAAGLEASFILVTAVLLAILIAVAVVLVRHPVEELAHGE
jgi:MFS family permease